MTDGYNFRNHELCAVLGLSQLKKLDKNIEIRKQTIVDIIMAFCSTKDPRTPQYQTGNSSFSFPIIPMMKSMLQRSKEL